MVPSSPRRCRLPLLGMLGLLGAPGCGVAALPVLDADHDGWIAPWDCDDRDPTVSPSAEERCDGVDRDCDGEIDGSNAADAELYYADLDGDGYGDERRPYRSCVRPSALVRVAGDCDDEDPATNPDAAETCDGDDDDCDGLADEADAVDAPRWYLDADGDGYGIPGVYQDACAAPGGYVADDTDCDDSDVDRSPGLPERCDAVDRDEDCDGLADDDDPEGAEGQVLRYLDADGDGWGTEADAVASCEALPERVDAGGDCDDGDARVSPGAEERCATGLDEDCDGLVDGEDPDAPEGGVPLYADEDLDGYGDPAVEVGTGCEALAGRSPWPTDCDDGDAEVSPAAEERWYDGIDADCDGGDDFDADLDGVVAESGGGADCDDADPEVLPGALEDCDDGVDSDCDGVADPCAPARGEDGALTEGSGRTVVIVGDIDDDGIDDAAIGADGADGGAGLVHLWSAAAGVTYGPEGDGDADRVGHALAPLGDVDGDGLPDLLVGMPGASLGSAADGGAVAVVPADAVLTPDDAWQLLLGAETDAWTGAAVAAGDTDGDGLVELLVGAPEVGARVGAAYVVPLQAGEVALTAAATWTGAGTSAAAGTALAAADGDGDGLSELVVGAPGADAGAGAVYVVDGAVALDGGALEDADATWAGGGGDHAGAVLAAADLDGDGRDELLIGAPDAGGGTGAAWVLHGALARSGELAGADLVLEGASVEDAAGSALAAGDLDGDGLVDLVIGAEDDSTGASGGGAVYLFLAAGSLGGSHSLLDADLRLSGTAEGGRLGRSAAVGDLDGDGQDDLLLPVTGTASWAFVTGW